MEKSVKIRKPIISPKFLEFWSKINGFNVVGFSFWKWIYLKNDYPETGTTYEKYRWDKLVNHESIHYYQQKELTYPIFLILYLLSYVFNLYKYSGIYNIFYSVLGTFISILLAYFMTIGWSIFIGWSVVLLVMMKLQHFNAYRNVVFEKEAYDNEANFLYLDTRKKFNWKNFL